MYCLYDVEVVHTHWMDVVNQLFYHCLMLWHSPVDVEGIAVLV